MKQFFTILTIIFFSHSLNLFGQQPRCADLLIENNSFQLVNFFNNDQHEVGLYAEKINQCRHGFCFSGVTFDRLTNATLNPIEGQFHDNSLYFALIKNSPANEAEMHYHGTCISAHEAFGEILNDDNQVIGEFRLRR